MDWNSGRVAGAHGDAKHFAGGLKFLLWIYQIAWGIALLALAYLSVPTQWIVAVGFIATCTTLASIMIPAIQRFDAGRAYLENTCASIETLIYDKN